MADDAKEWVMAESPENSRLIVSVEVKTPNGEWVETENEAFPEPGSYKLVKDE